MSLWGVSMRTYEIKGMTCAHCVRAVERALAKVPRVIAVHAVDLERGEARIEGSPDEHMVIAAVRDEGYEARRAP
jgi:copper chaperone